MNNPYEVLGVKENATDDEIKNAYRALARKYQADNYAGAAVILQIVLILNRTGDITAIRSSAMSGRK